MIPNKKKVKILLISEIQPISGTASSELLKRHLDQHSLSYHGIDETHPALYRGALDRLLLKVLSWFSESFRQCYVESIEPIFKSRKIANTIGDKHFDVVLSLAHGRLGLHAWKVGKHLGIPTVTLFHDWWPEMLQSYRGKRDLVVRSVERDFRLAAQNADMCLSVCPGMARRITPGSRSDVLYPIPDASITPSNICRTRQILRVSYTGSLWNPYGRMLCDLVSQIKGSTEFFLRIHGDVKYIEEPIKSQLLRLGILNNYIFGDSFIRCIQDESDVLLAVMGRDAEGECRMATSFPSKIANYFQTGNAVLLWALKGSSLEEFAREYDYPWVVSEADPTAVVKMLKQMANDPTVLATARADSLRIREQVFNANKIQRQFEQSLHEALLSFSKKL